MANLEPGKDFNILNDKISLVEKKSDYKSLRKKDSSSKEEGKSIEKSDDPIRMYLREMGGVELLSREGEIAIAKRIEAGKDYMIKGLFQSPLTAKEVFDWKPLQDFETDDLENVLGIQGQLWSETITNKDYFDKMINPRLAALAEIAWCTKAKRSWLQFRSSLINHLKYLSKLGWKFHNF